MENQRTIKVFCPEHGKVFVCQAKERILCGISGHTLSTNFPKGAVWEFCCDCRTFFPAAKSLAAAECPMCDRRIVSRYLCDNCSVISFESNEFPANKYAPDIDPEKGISGTCCGCGSAAGLPVKKHECEKAGIAFLSSRESCPFCERKIDESLSLVVFDKQKSEAVSAVQENKSLVCRNTSCNRVLPTSSSFCAFCGVATGPVGAFAPDKHGKPIPVLPDPKCPACYAHNPLGVAFCAQCGQSLEWPVSPGILPVPLAKAKEPPVKISPAEAAVAPAAVTPEPRKKPIAFIGCLIIFLFFVSLSIIGIISAISPSNTNAYPGPSITPAYNSAKSAPANSGNNTAYASSNNANNSLAVVNKISNNNTPANSASTSLTRTFTRSYQGFINNSNSIEMKLERNGDSLSGKVIPKGRFSTVITVDGKIGNDGSFNMLEYDDENNVTGRYEGQIKSTGAIEGTWSKPDGSRAVPFYLSQKNSP